MILGAAFISNPSARWALLMEGRMPCGQRIGDAVERLRLGMTQTIQTALPGSTGGIAASLVTGERGGISEEDEDALRDAGLAHVLAISGLHMAMVGGGIFWL